MERKKKKNSQLFSYFNSQINKNTRKFTAESIEERPIFYFMENRNITLNRKDRKKIKRAIFKEVDYENFTYEFFTTIAEKHCKYLEELEKNSADFKEAVRTAELTGAYITVGSKHGKSRSGIVVEDRINSLRIIFKDNTVKLFPKECNVFKLEYKKKNFYFFGKILK